MRAFLTGQQAHAAAQSRDRTQALTKLRETEAAMDRAESQAKALGSYDLSSMNYHIAQVRYELGDRTGSIEAMEKSDRVRHQVYRRGRVRHLRLLAQRKLELGRLDEACNDWGRMLDDYPSVQSGRCDGRFNTMMSALRPYRRNHKANELYEHGRALAQQH